MPELTYIDMCDESIVIDDQFYYRYLHSVPIWPVVLDFYDLAVGAEFWEPLVQCILDECQDKAALDVYDIIKMQFTDNSTKKYNLNGWYAALAHQGFNPHTGTLYAPILSLYASISDLENQVKELTVVREMPIRSYTPMLPDYDSGVFDDGFTITPIDDVLKQLDMFGTGQEPEPMTMDDLLGLTTKRNFCPRCGAHIDDCTCENNDAPLD